MSKTITLESAINTLKAQGYNHIEKDGRHYLRHSATPDSGDEISERRILKMARSGDRHYKKEVKKFDRIDRTKTRDAIKKEDFDNIPQNKQIHREDPWSWD